MLFQDSRGYFAAENSEGPVGRPLRTSGGVEKLDARSVGLG